MTPVTRDQVNEFNNSQLVQELGVFLSGFHWQAYCTPTFKYPVNGEYARRAAHKWLATLGPDVFAYVAYEQGKAGGRTHLHALLGGLGPSPVTHSGLNTRALAIKNVKRSWTHGDIQLDQYDARRGACWYLSKFPNDGEIIGVMKRHRVRRKH